MEQPFEEENLYGLGNLTSPTGVRRKRGRPRKSEVKEEIMPVDVVQVDFPYSDLVDGKVIKVGDEKGYKMVMENIQNDDELQGSLGFAVFELKTRANEWYGMALDVARHLGYRDSYSFFLKNEDFVKIWTTENERKWLGDQGLLNSAQKQRSLAVVGLKNVAQRFKHLMLMRSKEGLVMVSEAPILLPELLANVDDDGFEEDDEAMFAAKFKKRYLIHLKNKAVEMENEHLRRSSMAKAAYETAGFNSWLLAGRNNRNASCSTELFTGTQLLPFQSGESSQVLGQRPQRITHYDEKCESQYPIRLTESQPLDNYPMAHPHWRMWVEEKLNPTPPQAKPIIEQKKNDEDVCKVCFHGPPQEEERCSKCSIWVHSNCKGKSYACCCRPCELCKTSLKQSMMECEICQRAYHTSCLRPPVHEIPNKWICAQCIRCASCDLRPNLPMQKGSACQKWTHVHVNQKFLETLCSRCYPLFEKGEFCPVCYKAIIVAEPRKTKKIIESDYDEDNDEDSYGEIEESEEEDENEDENDEESESDDEEVGGMEDEEDKIEEIKNGNEKQQDIEIEDEKSKNGQIDNENDTQKELNKVLDNSDVSDQEQNELISCAKCKRSVHIQCDPIAEEMEDYCCPCCRGEPSVQYNGHLLVMNESNE